MTPSSHLSDNLSLLVHETSLLMLSTESLDDEKVRDASLCKGWTRALVLSHLARNADALGNLVSWAVTGKPVAMYASPGARDAEITAGSQRGHPKIVTDLRDSARRFDSAAAGLAGPPEHVEVEMRAGRKVLGGQLPTLRLLEVVIHHIDLAAGYTFSDADPAFVRRAISNALERMRTHDQLPAVSLRGDNGDTWSIGSGPNTHVTGTNAALLLWLARGDGAGLSSQDAAPALPPWG